MKKMTRKISMTIITFSAMLLLAQPLMAGNGNGPGDGSGNGGNGPGDGTGNGPGTGDCQAS